MKRFLAILLALTLALSLEMRERAAPPAVLTLLPRTRSSPSASAS